MEIKEIKIYKISKTLAIMRPTGIVENVTYNFEKPANCVEDAAAMLASDLEVITKELRVIATLNAKPTKKPNVA